MPTFKIDTPGGSFEVEAPDLTKAVTAVGAFEGSSADTTGHLLPLRRDKKGDLSLAVPRLLSDMWAGTKDAVTVPGDVARGRYNLPMLDEPGIAEDDAGNVYQHGRLVGNRTANERSFLERAIGLGGMAVGTGTGLTATRGARHALDSSVLRSGGGGGKPKPRQVVKIGDRTFLTSSDGTIDFGRIRKEVSEASGGRFPEKPIRLQTGESAFGADHFSGTRRKPAQDLGYHDEIEMVEDISRNYDLVVEQANGRLMLVKKNGTNRYSIIELIEGEDAFYGTTTIFPESSGNFSEKRTSLYRTVNRRGGRILWNRK